MAQLRSKLARMLNAIAQAFDTVPTHWRLARTQAGPAARSRADMRFIDLGNTLIRLRQAGTRGPSLVIATDPPVPLELYDGLIASLANRYRVTAFELPGFGCSLPRVGFQLSMRSAVHAVTQLLRQLPHGPHVLALPCVTGFIALAIARAEPSLVGRLVLMQTPSWADAQLWLAGRDPNRILQRPIVGQLALAAMRNKRIRQWYRMALADQGRVDEFSDATLQNFADGGCVCLASAYQDFLQDHQGLLGPVAQDTLLVWGNADPSHRTTDFYATQALTPNNCALQLDGAGHFPELEASAAFVSALDSFLRP